jgi:alpha-galactosidase
MSKITFMGAGSSVFAKAVIGDSLLTPALRNSQVALYDIDATRLKESKLMLDAINANVNEGRATITAHLGVRNRRDALRGANYIVNAIQVGGYEPSTVIDFEVPKKYGLRQTIGDTLGIGGIFRALRTIPVLMDFARDMEEVAPHAWLLNYSNPMAMLTGALLHGSGVRTVGLCHSVQGCAWYLLKMMGMLDKVKKLRWEAAGINHMTWMLSIRDGDKDLYPEIKRRAAALMAKASHKGYHAIWDDAKKRGDGNPWADQMYLIERDLVRLTLMQRFGYYVTESSEHNSEYTPYWIKASQPDLIDHYNIPLDEYPRRCVSQIAGWKKQSKDLVQNKALTHTKSHEYAAGIMEAIETDMPARVHGNVLNRGLIPNLPDDAVVEVPCLVDGNGVQGCYVGKLPESLAGLNRTNINPQLVAIQAALTQQRDLVYQAAYLDPHCAGELSLDQIRAMCDDLIKAHGKMLPKYR